MSNAIASFAPLPSETVATLLDQLDAHFAPGPLGASLGLPTAVPRDVWDRALAEPLRDFLGRSGKEFRAELVRAAHRIAGGGSLPDVVPALVEMLHAGSLVVDDIEDDSATRRGRASLHRLYGVPTALNAGNWLYFWPFVVASELGLRPELELRLHRVLGRTLFRAHHGQALDVAVPVHELHRSDVPSVVSATTRLKTGALMECAARIGAIVAGAPEPLEAEVGAFGHALGVALQQLDDLGGLVSRRRRHKGLEDLLQRRPTWPWAWLAEQEPVSFERLRRALATGADPEVLADELGERTTEVGRHAVSTGLAAAFAELRSRVGHREIIGRLEQEIARLERSYE